MVYPLTTGFHWGSLDFRWYIEGCCSIPSYANTDSGFHDINRFITLGTHPGTDNIAIPDYVEAVSSGREMEGTTPIQVSQTLHACSDKALQIFNQFPMAAEKELKRTLGDIRAMAYMGKYYAHKIRGATELALYRNNKKEQHRSRAVDEMTQAASYWDLYTNTALNQYHNPIDLNRNILVDWQALRKDVQKDIAIAIAGADFPQEMAPENTVLFIRNPDSDRAQHDLNIIAVLGTKGISIDGRFIPGLGLNVQTVDPGSADEARK